MYCKFELNLESELESIFVCINLVFVSNGDPSQRCFLQISLYNCRPGSTSTATSNKSVPSGNSSMVKFMYFEKATKLCEISTLLLSYAVPVKIKVEISQNFVAFSEYMNFILANLCLLPIGQFSKFIGHFVKDS